MFLKRVLVLNTGRLACVSAEHPFVEFANPIPRKRGDGFDTARMRWKIRKGVLFYFALPFLFCE